MTGAPTKSEAWFLVAHNLLHLDGARPDTVTWWCVTRGAAPGNRCFVYKPLTGVVLYFEILHLTERREFCGGFAMATAAVKILKVFEPPITVRELKSSTEVRKMGFMTRNLQGKAFRIDGQDAKTILKLHKPKAKSS